MIAEAAQFLVLFSLTCCAFCDKATSKSNDEVIKEIGEICRRIKEADQNVYWALEMKYKPAMNKTLLKKNLGDYNDALLALRRLAATHKDEVLRVAKEICDEGLPKYFRVTFAEYKLQDNLDMESEEIENIYVYRGKAMESWTSLHFELGIPWE